MSLYSSNYPAGAQFDSQAPWEPDYIEQSIHEIDAEPFLASSELPTMPDTPSARAWKQRLMDACTEYQEGK